MTTTEKSIGDTPTLIELWGGFNGEVIQHQLKIIETYTPSVSKGITHKNIITNSFTPSILKNLTLTHILNVTSSFLPLPVSIYSNVPTIEPINNFLLYNYSNEDYNSPDIILPPPDYNDDENFKPIRINRYTRNNTLVIFGELYWGSEWLFEYKFSDLTDNEQKSLGAFLETNVGKRIRIFDHTGVSRIGIVTNGGPSRVENAPRVFNFTMQFQQIFETSP